MTEVEVFILADQALNNVVQQINDDQWSLTLPEWFQVGRTGRDGLDLRKVINYHAYDEAWVPITLAGKATDDPDGPANMADDLLGAEPKASFAAITERGIAAARALDDPERITHLSYGDYPARDYLMHITSFRGFRAFDISKLIGADTKLPDDLVEGMWSEFSPHFDEWRAMGVFKAALPVPDGASLQDKLFLTVGREL